MIIMIIMIVITIMIIVIMITAMISVPPRRASSRSSRRSWSPEESVRPPEGLKFLKTHIHP